MDTFWIAMVSGAILLGCALGVASLTSRDDSAEDERMSGTSENRGVCGSGRVDREWALGT